MSDFRYHLPEPREEGKGALLPSPVYDQRRLQFGQSVPSLPFLINLHSKCWRASPPIPRRPPGYDCCWTAAWPSLDIVENGCTPEIRRESCRRDRCGMYVVFFLQKINS